ncbi:MAG TPA: hypothetical protein VGI03_05540 [Verrucomicrobiae bacterium]|jgi:hypothetical protein
MKLRNRFKLFFVSALCLLAPPVFAQIGGGGWTPLSVIFKIQSPTNAPQSQRYFFTNNLFHCLTYSNDGAFSIGNTTSPRTEQRFEPDYTNGEIQYQATLMAAGTENSYCVFQIHTGDAQSPTYGSTTFMAFWFTNYGGSIHDYSGTTLATNLGNKWFQLNVDHSLVTHAIRVWINQNLVWTQQDNGATDYYFKDGVYEQSHNPTYEMDTYITNTIKIWVSPGTDLPPKTNFAFQAVSLTYITNGAVTAVEADSNEPGGEWLELAATGANQSIQYSIPEIPAGTYDLQMLYKPHFDRGELSFALDGTILGTLDQYLPSPATQTYPAQDWGNVTFSTNGTHAVQLTVTGKNAASSGYLLSAAEFVFSLVQPPPPVLDGALAYDNGVVQLGGSGYPTLPYRVQVSTNPASTDWLTIGTANADTHGALNFIDTNATDQPMEFYRLVTP